MINQPLKLRLYIPQKPNYTSTYIRVMRGAGLAELQFQNPLNGSWHPVEVVEAEPEIEKPA